jgi:oligopeptidase B
MMVCGGMNDPRVAFYEPVKYVAKLRHHKIGDQLLLLRVDDAGHGGASGQYAPLEHLAQEYAFLIYTLGAPMHSVPPPVSMQPQDISETYLNSPRRGSVPVTASPRTNIPRSWTSYVSRSPAVSPTHVPIGDEDRMPARAAYRTAGKKGDRGVSRMYQWLANFF